MGRRAPWATCVCAPPRPLPRECAWPWAMCMRAPPRERARPWATCVCTPPREHSGPAGWEGCAGLAGYRAQAPRPQLLSAEGPVGPAPPPALCFPLSASGRGGTGQARHRSPGSPRLSEDRLCGATAGRPGLEAAGRPPGPGCLMPATCALLRSCQPEAQTRRVAEAPLPSSPGLSPECFPKGSRHPSNTAWPLLCYLENGWF